MAQDIVKHFLGRGFQGKAMVVSIDKATALRMYDKVRKYWPKDDNTDMAVVVSPGQNEIEQMAKLGIDIVPHRKRVNDEKLDEKFKDPNDPLRLVFVCAMWLTGFDAPSCSTIYLDKPMRNHTLMQTIARANRVYPGKHSGLIVDYANVFASLEKALAIYGKGGGGEMPVRDKKALADELRYAVNDTNVFCLEHSISLAEIETMPTANFAQAGAITAAADRLMAPEIVKRDFLALESLVNSLYRALKPDQVAVEFAQRCGCLAAIANCIRTVTEPPDISHIMQGIQDLLDASIATEPFKIRQPTKNYGQIDLSKIDFAALRKRFEDKKPSNTDVERLKAAVKAQLERLVRLNPTRADYLEKFQELIESYNAGSRNIDEIFKELLALSSILTEEQSRHVRENLSEEELTILDILTRPAPELTTEEREEVKKVAHHLLEKLKKLLVLGWRQKVSSRAKVQEAIKDMLDEELPRAYSKEIYEAKCSAIFEHVYQSYQGEGQSVYAA